MDINCAPLVADLFLLRYESDFMLSLSVDTQSNVIEEYVGKPSETDPIKFNISFKTSRGKTAQKDTTTDIASDSLVNSNFPHRWSPASLALNYFYHFFIFIYNKNNHKQQCATSKEPKQKTEEPPWDCLQ